MVINEDIKALAKQAYELGQLPQPEQAARKWEAVAVCGQIISAATPAGLVAAQAALEARWGDKIRAQGLAALVDPWWYLRADDGQPPVIAAVIESAMTNPNRPLGSTAAKERSTEASGRSGLVIALSMRAAITGGLPSSARRYHHGSTSAASPCARIWVPHRASSAAWAAVRPAGVAALTICPHTATASHLRAARSGSGSCASS